MTRPAANLLAQQLGWFACVLGAAHGHSWWGVGAALALTAAHLVAAPDRPGELALIGLALAISLVADTGLQAAGLMTYQSRWESLPLVSPPWILALWGQFATTLRHGMRWLWRWQAAPILLGAVGGPLAFRAGEALGAARFAPERWHTVVALGVEWAIALPLLVLAARRIDQRGGRGGHGTNALVRSA